MPLMKLRHRRDATIAWEAANPILEPGELGLEVEAVDTDGSLKFYQENGKNKALYKLGDGKTAWKDLPYASGPQGPQGDKGDKGEGNVVFPPISDNTNLNDSSVYASSKAVNSLRTNMRIQCTKNFAVYVATNGNDNNDGLTLATPKKTIQAAVNALKNVDGRGHNMFVEIGAGTFDCGTTIAIHPFNNAVGSRITFRGAGKGITILKIASGNVFSNYGPYVYARDMTIQGGVYCSESGIIQLDGDLALGPVQSNGGTHVAANRKGKVLITATSCDVYGDADSFLRVVSDGGSIEVNTTGINFINTPTFGTATCLAVGGYIYWNKSCTYKGTAKGKRFVLDYAGSICCGVIDPNAFLPGNAVGEVRTNAVIGAKVLDHTHPAPEITGTAKAWGVVAAAGTVKASQGVASIARTTTATYAVTFKTPAPNVNYVVGVNPALYSNSYLSGANVTSKTTTGFTIQIYYVQSTSTRLADLDFDFTVHW